MYLNLSAYLIGGLDFDIFSDFRLVFSPTLSSHVVHVNIFVDGHFEEETESFSVALSTRRVLPLQLKTKSVDLKLIACDGENILDVFTISNNSAASNEDISIDLDRVILTQRMDGIAFSLTDNEISRLTMNPTVATVNILDTDSKHTHTSVYVYLHAQL